jgi:HDOD domain
VQKSAATISASLKKVPPFPPVAAKLLSLLSNPAVDTNEVADLIASDATFTARLLAERWGLPSEMAVIAGRHHDPCDGAELDLLGIVHVACRLADVLGYYVVKPLSQAKVGDVIAPLPAQARARLGQAPAELCQRIEQKLQEFGSEASDAPPPEETLALLASASATQDPEPPAYVAPSDVEVTDELRSLEFVEKPNPPARNWAIILWIVAGVAVVAAAVLWALR